MKNYLLSTYYLARIRLRKLLTGSEFPRIPERYFDDKKFAKLGNGAGLYGYALVYKRHEEGVKLEVMKTSPRVIRKNSEIDSMRYEFWETLKDISKDSYTITWEEQLLSDDFNEWNTKTIGILTRQLGNRIANSSKRGRGNILIATPEYVQFLKNLIPEEPPKSFWRKALEKFVKSKKEPEHGWILREENQFLSGLTLELQTPNMEVYSMPNFNDYWPDDRAILMYSGVTVMDGPIYVGYSTNYDLSVNYLISTIDDVIDNDGVYSTACDYIVKIH